MSFGNIDACGWKRLTTSGIVGDSGKAIDIMGYTILSGATAGNIFFFNATTNTAAAFAFSDQARAVSAEQSIPVVIYPIRLPAGCYVSFDGNVTATTIFYRQSLT